MSIVIDSSNVSDSVRTAFNFTVDKFPLSGPDNMKTDQFGLFRSDIGYITGVKSVSPRYVPHTTDDVCALVEAAGEAFDGEIECDTYWRSGHYVKIQPTRAERERIFGENDNIWPRIVIRAGYDGQAFTGMMGYYRDACRNLAIMRQVKGTTVSIRHTSGLRKKMNELIQTFSILKNSWANLTDVIHRLQSKEVRMSEFLDKIYGKPTDEQLAVVASGQAIRAVTVHKQRTEDIWNRLNAERNATGREPLQDNVSLWEAYNAIQGYVQHDAQAKKGFTGEFSRIIRASNDLNVIKAEKLVLSLAS